jgi:hypothetical protein
MQNHKESIWEFFVVPATTGKCLSSFACLVEYYRTDVMLIRY